MAAPRPIAGQKQDYSTLMSVSRTMIPQDFESRREDDEYDDEEDYAAPGHAVGEHDYSTGKRRVDLKGRSKRDDDEDEPKAAAPDVDFSKLMKRMEERMTELSSTVKVHDPTFKDYFSSLHHAYFRTAYEAGLEAGKLMAPAPKCLYCERRKENNRIAAQVVREKQRNEKREREEAEVQMAINRAIASGHGAKGLLTAMGRQRLAKAGEES